MHRHLQYFTMRESPCRLNFLVHFVGPYFVFRPWWVMLQMGRCCCIQYAIYIAYSVNFPRDLYTSRTCIYILLFFMQLGQLQLFGTSLTGTKLSMIPPIPVLLFMEIGIKCSVPVEGLVYKEENTVSFYILCRIGDIAPRVNLGALHCGVNINVAFWCHNTSGFVRFQRINMWFHAAWFNDGLCS